MSSDQLAVTVTDGFVPVIDLSSRDSARGRAAIAEAIGGALRSSGFFIIVGHGVPQQLIDRMFTVTNSFFKLPEDEKDLVASRPGVSGYRRAGGTLARSLDQKTPPDLCETFAAHVTGELADDERDKLGGQWASWTHKNIWPENPAGFRDTWQQYMAAMEDLAADLMRLFARALDLDLDEEFFADKFDHHGSSIAVNYYPPQLEAPLPGQLRRGPHTDFGSLTILHQEDDKSGLQVLQNDGTWRDVAAIPNSFVVNIGDLMALWTGGRWVSTMHRVANPPGGDTSSRLTMPFFYLPNHDASIEPMRPFTDSPAVERFDTVTVSEWVSRKVQKIFS
ncbi:isopenicillin N synthase family dioxygenase [Streptomyces spectabilis]|uniref:Isopenicillin N synthase family oxygenase n=1 Tax=Streptomyces spectabilis TaxID=68270 RepID=A0A5P2XAW2_STRST|nr:2-oxoglutarate and iron-dependent oxygenase domain-containing protein [Streptomyces spectabilis]MBB5104518.1 isopenicillin N synthase-like dioxygenase [Streptomyces spectabilis]MCI3905127.1 isopenicillin N synthase family oxygenase [Streptomyces spectabilis]QEV62143.1 isopenicillin N synthase family oxygenase [Streptomyces spectabilis]GGV00473.1 2OG-Fe(II) oxygenase [Streptomyces spectabilis]